MSLTIALIVPGFSAGPDDWAIPALLNLARTLAPYHRLHVFSQRYPAPGLYRFDGLTHRAGGGGQNFGPASVKIWVDTAQAVIRQHRQRPFDLLHAFWADEAGFSAALAGAAIRRPVVISLGGGELTRLPGIRYGAQRFLARRLTTRFALRRAARVTAGSTYQLELGRAQGVPGAKLRLAPLGVDTNRFSPPDRSAPVPVMVQAAALRPVKNQALLLHVAARVRQQQPQARLHLAGNGPLKNELRQLAYRLKLSHNIVWAGQIPYPRMPDFLRGGSVYLQTSQHESQGMAALEAMACGLPLLGTPVGVAAELACAPASGRVETLAQQVDDLLSDDTRYAKARQQARQVVEQWYSLAMTAQNFINIYAEVL